MPYAQYSFAVPSFVTVTESLVMAKDGLIIKEMCSGMK